MTHNTHTTRSQSSVQTNTIYKMHGGYLISFCNAYLFKTKQWAVNGNLSGTVLILKLNHFKVLQPFGEMSAPGFP